MILNSIYKNYARQIAELFCDEGDNLCVESVKARIIVNLNNRLFENYFLPQLDKSRFYAFTGRVMHHLWHTGYEFTAQGFDIVTNRLVTHEFHRVPPEILNKPAQLFNSVSHYNYLGQVNGNHIVERMRGEPYGLFFVPGSPGGGFQGGGGTITVDPPVVTPPGVPSQEPVIKGAGMEKILSDPLVLVGAAALLFIYLMND